MVARVDVGGVPPPQRGDVPQNQSITLRVAKLVIKIFTAIVEFIKYYLGFNSTEDRFLRLVLDIPRDDRQHFLINLSGFMPDLIKEQQNVNISSFFSALDPYAQEDPCTKERLIGIIPSEFYTGDNLKVIRHLFSFPRERVSEILERVNLENGRDLDNVLQALSNAWEEVKNNPRRIQEDTPPSPNRNPEEQDPPVERVIRFAAERRQAAEFFQGLDAHDQGLVADALDFDSMASYFRNNELRTNLLRKLITDEMDCNSRLTVIQLVKEIPLQTVLPCANALFQGEIENASAEAKINLLKSIMEVIKKFSFERSFWSKVEEFITETMSYDQRWEIINFLNNSFLETNEPLPASNHIKAALAHAMRFIHDGMEDSDRIALLCHCNNLMTATINQISELTASLVLPNTGAAEINAIFDKIHLITPNKRNEFVELAQTLVGPAIGDNSISDLLDAIYRNSRISAKERAWVVELVMQLFSEGEELHGVTDLINRVYEIPRGDRDQIVPLAAELLQPNMPLEDKIAIMERIIGFDRNQRDWIVHFTCRFIQGNINLNAIQSIMHCISVIPEDDREEVVNYAAELNRANLNAEDRVAIINAVRGLAANARAAAVNRARILPNNATRAQLIAAFAEPPPPVLAVLAPAPALVQPQRAMNVHNGDRDERTRQAVQSLVAHQANVTAVEIQQAKDAFITYLDAKIVENHQASIKAKRALLDPREVRADGSREPFGPYIEQGYFTLLGFRIVGAEFIGRLWIYASSLADPLENENAKMGMIAALADCFNGNDRVCNQGKTQRLAINVLQGRLPGVKIDNIEIDEAPPLTPDQALNLFTQVQAHQVIDKVDELEEAAVQYCNENPRVPKNAFMQKVFEYAELMGFDNGEDEEGPNFVELKAKYPIDANN